MAKRKKESLRTKGYRNRIKGRLFELVLKNLIEKAGFNTNLELAQLTKSKKKLRGRGGTYAPDLLGVFSLHVPFAYPFLLVGEAKYHKARLQIKDARSFLGAYIDVSQYTRIETKSSKLFKYTQIFEGRYNYLPVIFSRSGFARNAQALLYTHGVYFVSYENSAIFKTIEYRLERLFKKINYGNVKNQHLQSLDSLDGFRNITGDIKLDGYDQSFEDLMNVLYPVQSYVGIIDGLWPINILTKNKRPLKPLTKFRECGIVVKDNQVIVNRTTNRRSPMLGVFSLPTYFLDEYRKVAQKRDKKILRELTLFIPKDGKIFPLYVKLVNSDVNST